MIFDPPEAKKVAFFTGSEPELVHKLNMIVAAIEQIQDILKFAGKLKDE